MAKKKELAAKCEAIVVKMKNQNLNVSILSKYKLWLEAEKLLTEAAKELVK